VTQSSLFATGYVIAAEKPGGVVWGTGRDEAEARRDAAREGGVVMTTLPPLVVVPATEALAAAIQEHGGGVALRWEAPWTITEGVAHLKSERVLACETDR